MNFVNLTPVEITGRGFEVVFILDHATVNINRIMALNVMEEDYRQRFPRGETKPYYATVSLKPGTFRPGTQLGIGPAMDGKNSASVVHWWITREQYDRLMKGAV